MTTLEQKINIILECIASDNFVDEGIKRKAREALAEPSDEADINIKPAVDVDDMIFDLFKELGVSPNLNGYKYAFIAVKLALDDPRRLNALVGRIYVDIASEYGTTPACIERSIRTIIQGIFDRGNYESAFNVFGNIMSAKSGKITNGEFISGCVYEINRRMKRIQKSVM